MHALIRVAIAVVLAVTTLGAAALAGGSGSAQALDNGLALTPPMGWNGFNHFGRDVTAAIVEGEAAAIVRSGMKSAGYQYVNLDGGWDSLQRDSTGSLQPDPANFPDGIKALADHVHALGLKFGIYTDAGYTNCAATAAGSYGHYQQDADTFASWGVDYVKMDYCYIPYENYPGLTKVQVDQALAAQMRDALARTGRPIVFSITLWGQDQDWTWASGFANLWRTTGDVGNSYSSMASTFAANAPLFAYAGPGGWNDPDMLEVGNGGMTDLEDQSHFSLWAEMAAPLLAGADLRAMTDATRAIYTNAEVVAVDQDPLGRQGYPVQDAGGHWVLSKPMAHGARAVLLFNQSDLAAVITTTAEQAGLPEAPGYLVRDLWGHSTSLSRGTIEASLAPHAVAMYRVVPI